MSGMDLTPGLYRNTLGAELEVTGAWLPSLNGGRVKSLGGIHEAVQHDDLFGPTHYLVTAQSMAATGYELIKEATGA